MTRVVLDELDAGRLLRILYNGTRPDRVHILICVCGALADRRERPDAWQHWLVLPHPKCPDCLAVERDSWVYAPSPNVAREEFLKSIGKEGWHERSNGTN